ncbi:hypothetical protein [Aureivirga sp. CE67]|uniref:hypothetical protein n=1 Tax=Aureivirga sp. CE67 TaxID=1788983 RepID=UPI0018C9851D|nr:hypothetical protein [Aureivirga sp. CE67]
MQDIEYIFRIHYDIQILKKYSDSHSIPENIKSVIDYEYDYHKLKNENQSWQEFTYNHFAEK